MDAGQLNRLVSLQQRATTRDAAGQKVGAWEEVAQVWADIRYTGGLEQIRSGAEVATTAASVRIRFRSDVSAGMRLVEGPVVFDIKAVLPQAGREYVDLVCHQGASNG